jgi:hypothetical protein
MFMRASAVLAFPRWPAIGPVPASQRFGVDDKLRELRRERLRRADSGRRQVADGRMTEEDLADAVGIIDAMIRDYEQRRPFARSTAV